MSRFLSGSIVGILGSISGLEIRKGSKVLRFRHIDKVKPLRVIMDETTLEVIAYCAECAYPIYCDDGFCRNCGCTDY